MKVLVTSVEVIIATVAVASLAVIGSYQLDRARSATNFATLETNFNTLASAINAYDVDNAHFPSMATGGNSSIALTELTTPIAYLPNLDSTLDPFLESEPTVTVANDIPAGGVSYAFEWLYYANYQEFAARFPGNQSYDGWILTSVGPDRIYESLEFRYHHIASGGPTLPEQFSDAVYDPTNGASSSGDLFHQEGEPTTAFSGNSTNVPNWEVMN